MKLSDPIRSNETDANRAKKINNVRQKMAGMAAVEALVDSTGGTADGTLEAVPSDTLVNNAAAANNNFAEINAKLDAILAALAD